MRKLLLAAALALLGASAPTDAAEQSCRVIVPQQRSLGLVCVRADPSDPMRFVARVGFHGPEFSVSIETGAGGCSSSRQS